MAGQPDDEKRRIAQRTCTLCLNSYREPKILPCFDSFCCACLKGVVSLWVSGKDDLKSIPCPRCRELFPLPDDGVDGLRDNMYLDDCESSPAILDRPIACQLCNERREITMLCYDCKDLYCHDCKRIHDRVDGTRSHGVHMIVQDYYSQNSPQTSLFVQGLDEPSVNDLYICDEDDLVNIYDDNEEDKADLSNGHESQPTANEAKTSLGDTAEYLIPGRELIPSRHNNRNYVNVPKETERPPLPPRPQRILPADKDNGGKPFRKAFLESSYVDGWNSSEEESPYDMIPPPKPDKKIMQVSPLGAFMKAFYKTPGRDDKNVPEEDQRYEMIPDNFCSLPTPDKKGIQIPPLDTLRETPYADIPYFVDALLESFGKLPTYVTKLECTPRRNVYSICIANKTDIVMISKVNKKTQLSVYPHNGGKRREKELASEHVTVASVNDNIFFVAERDWNNVYWTTTDSLQVNKLSYVTTKRPVLSKPVPGKSIHIIGKSHEGFFWVVQRIEFARNTFPVTELIVDDNVVSFDVSADREYFAVMSSTQRLYVYCKDQKEPKSAYECHGGGDVCFYTKGGREVLLVADTHQDSIVMLDHTKDCNVLGRTSIPRPACMTKDEKGRLWVACNWDGKTATKTQVLLF